jgi:metal-responsive CopG/Arc/MetJ family transcriptional regulator
MDLQKTQTEKIISLQADLTEDLEKLAARQRVSPDEIIATALRRYIRQLQEQKIEEEAEAFRAAHAELVTQYQGQVVALHEGQVVDHDEDFVALHRRIRSRFGHTAVLLRRVGPEPERALTFRSPRFERGKL